MRWRFWKKRDRQLEADMAAIVDYLTGDASVEEMVAINERLENDARFRESVGPLVTICTLPQRLLAPGKEPLPHPDSDEAWQAEWESFFQSVDLPMPPREEIPGGMAFRPKAASLPPGPTPPKKPSKLRKVAVIVASLLPGALLGYCARGPFDAYPSAVAETIVGRELPPGAAFSVPTIYQSKPDEVRRIETSRGVITLQGLSRYTEGGFITWLTSGMLPIGAVDGEAEIIVKPGRLFSLQAGVLQFALRPGGYHVTHWPGGPARIVVDSGRANYKLHYFPQGSIVTALARDTITTLTATLAGERTFGPVPFTNHGVRP